MIFNNDFPYVDELPDWKLNQLNTSVNKVYIDPGKRSLLTMLGDNGEYLSYTNGQRLRETKRLKFFICFPIIFLLRI